MRIRFKPYARPELEAWPHFINNALDLKGKWKEAYANPQLPFYLELGCGKGGFAAAVGCANPNINFLGVDIKSEVLVVAKRAIEKAYEQNNLPLNNLLITSWNIENIGEMLSAQDSVDRIYINFCNPCQKGGYAKHRLTHPRQLVKYRAFLKEGAPIYFKTDDDPLFEDSLRYFELSGFEVEWLSRNLHTDEPDWNVRTEHEKMFSDEGIPIKACIAYKKEVELDWDSLLLSKNI